MAATLATLTARVLIILADSGAAIWAAADTTEAIRRALHAYSLSSPLHKIATLTLTADGRELSTTTLTNPIAIEAVWCPYTAANPEYPPYKRAFRFWPDSSLLYITGQYEPQSGDIARVFYSSLHLLSGLDSAASTTIPVEHDSIIATGAAGHAAQSRALDLAEQVTVDREAVDRLTKWGHQQLLDFGTELTRIAIAHQGTAHVPMPPLDRWDDEWA